MQTEHCNTYKCFVCNKVEIPCIIVTYLLFLFLQVPLTGSTFGLTSPCIACVGLEMRNRRGSSNPSESYQSSLARPRVFAAGWTTPLWMCTSIRSESFLTRRLCLIWLLSRRKAINSGCESQGLWQWTRLSPDPWDSPSIPMGCSLPSQPSLKTLKYSQYYDACVPTRLGAWTVVIL